MLSHVCLWTEAGGQPYRMDTFANHGDLINGVWQSVGDGYLLDISPQTIKLYSYTEKYCYEDHNEFQLGQLKTSSQYVLRDGGDSLSVFLHDLGKRTRNLQDENKYYRINRLPRKCKEKRQPSLSNPAYLFELFCATLKENYAFSLERHLDWAKIYAQYRPRVKANTTQRELFDLLGEIVTLTQDQHTKIISKAYGTKQYTTVPTALLLAEVFRQQDTVTHFDTFVNQFFRSNYRNISENLLGGRGEKVANDKIEFGDLTSDIGYLHIHSFTGFANGTRQQQLDTLDFHMSRIIQSFERKKAIIVDVAFNFGGYDAAGLTISSYFTDRPVKVYTKYTFGDGRFDEGTPYHVYPALACQFTKPVYLLTTDITRSAAESFAMQMKSLPHVKLVGTNSLGTISDMLGKSIGEFYLTLSNEKYVSPGNAVYEVDGVRVDIPLTIFPADNMFNGHQDAVRRIARMVEQD